MMEHKQKPLCPFKKVVEKDYSHTTGKTTIMERFDVCAGERCMAHYKVGGREMCRRLEAGK